MTVCTRLSERMPAMAHGWSDWTADEAGHLTACSDCRAEWALVSAAARLGASLRPSTDPAATSARVLERIAAERRRDRAHARTWIGAGVAAAAAAAVALAIWTGRIGEPSSTRPETELPAVPSPIAQAPAPPPQPIDTSKAPIRPSAPVRWELPMPELDSLSVEELDALLGGLDEALAQVEAGGAALDEPGDAELEAVLAGLEG